MNPLSIVGGMAGIGIGSAITNGISALFSNLQQRQNLKMMREQMAYQTAEREASQDYQTSERLAQQAYQTSERDAQNIWQESMYGKYQSPEAMVRQYNEAGINGKLAASGQAGMGNMSVSGGSNGGAPSSGAPSGHSVSAPYQNINAWSAGFENVAGVLRAFADAKKAGIETKFLEDTYEERVRGEIRKADMLDVDWNIKKLYGSATARAAYERLMAEIGKTNAEKDKVLKELDILKKEEVIKDFDVDKLWDRWHHEVTNWAMGVGTAQQNIWESEQRIEQMKAVINNLNVDSTYKSRLSEQIKIGNEILKQTQKGEIDRIIATNKQIIDTIPQSIELLNQQLALATKNNDWFVYNQIIDGIKVLAEVGLAAGVLKGRNGSPTSPPTHYHTHTGSTTNNIYNGGVAPM